MTFRQLELFVLVCQYKSIARVSELNFVSAQSISRMIKDLESELGCTLFERTSTGFLPTEIGTYFHKECLTILEKKDAMIAHIDQMNRETKKTIRIGMAMGAIAALNYHLFDEFQAIYPHTEIEYAEFLDTELEECFSQGEFDFCIATKPLEGIQYHNTKILSEKVYLSIPPQHDLYLMPEISMEDISNYEFAMFTDAFHIRKKFMNCFQKTNCIPNIKISSSDFNSIKSLAYQNNLLTLDVQHSLKKEHGFRHVLFPCADLSHEYWIVKNTQNLAKDTEQLWQYLIDKF